MRVLAARISKTAIPWRTRGPDGRRGQLRLVNPVRQRAALMVLRMHSVTVGLAGDSESSPAGEVLGVVLRMHSVTVGMARDSESSPPG
jgi:hypothetical protein